MGHVDLSYWDIQQLAKPIDVLIVGAGITGLSCAMRLSQLRPELTIRIVDLHDVTRVASTRNAGFACFGSLTEILDDETNFGREVALDLVRRRFKGIQLIKKTFHPAEINYHQTGGYEILPEEEWSKELIESKIEHLATDLNKIIGNPVFSHLDRSTVDFPFISNSNVVYNPHEGQLNPALYVKQLATRLPKVTTEILSGVKVNDMEFRNNRWNLETTWGNMKATQVVLATNGLTGKLGLASKQIKPARNMVIVSEECELKFKGVFHAEKGYIYFRNVGKRLLIGGGRHWDKEAEFTSNLGNNDMIINKLKRYVQEVILPNKVSLEFPFQWSGIMGITENKTPIVEKIADQLFLAAGFGGMGVALGMHSGFQIAELACKDNFY